MARKSGKFHLENTNQNGHVVTTDASPAIGGTNLGARPMELLLCSLGSCSAIDVILILSKQRQQLEDISIDIEGQRVSVGNHSEFSKIHVHFKLFGEIKEKKAQKAVELSLEEYCSVAHILRKSASITYSFEINPA